MYYSVEVPKGAIEREVCLAHGSKTGYIVDDDIVFLDNSMTVDEGPRVCLISLGRFINYGAKICWDRQGAYLKMLGGESCELYMHNNCPYVSLDIVKKFEKLKETEYKNRRLNVSTTCSAMDLAMPQVAMVKIDEKPWKIGKVLEELPT